MILVLTVAALGVIVLVAWRIQPRQTYTPDPDDPLDNGNAEPIDREALERAEREVRGLGATVSPEDERPEDDWGPGTKQRD